MPKYIKTLTFLFLLQLFLPIKIYAAPVDPKFDVNGDGLINLKDVIFLIGVIFEIPNPTTVPTPTVSVTKFPTPTPTKTPTPVATPTLTASIGVTPIPTSSNSQSLGILITPEEIMKLPTTGSAWNNVLATANGSWGSVDIGNLNSDHDIKTLAGALVAVRNNDSSMRNKVIAALVDARNFTVSSGSTRALELSRNIQPYIFAADIIGYRDTTFMNWVSSSIRNTTLADHSCSSKTEGSVICTAKYSANNWGGHARGATTAAALYLKDTALLNDMVEAEKKFIGLSSTNNVMVFGSTNWHAGSPKAGVNITNAKMSDGFDVSGVLPEDWRRAGEYSSSSNIDISSGDANYKWEGMQGFTVTAVLLHRAGKLAFTAGDNAVVRAVNMLYKVGYKPNGDDTWIPWMVNYYGGSTFATSTANTGKNMGYTDWLYAK